MWVCGMLLPHTRSKVTFFRTNRIHVNHGGFNRAMTEPLLQHPRVTGTASSFNAKAVPQSFRRRVRADDIGRRHRGRDVLPRLCATPGPQGRLPLALTSALCLTDAMNKLQGCLLYTSPSPRDNR